MGDIVNTQVKRLYTSLLSHTDEATAVGIACVMKLPKNPSDKMLTQNQEIYLNMLNS